MSTDFRGLSTRRWRREPKWLPHCRIGASNVPGKPFAPMTCPSGLRERSNAWGESKTRFEASEALPPESKPSIEVIRCLGFPNPSASESDPNDRVVTSNALCRVNRSLAKRGPRFARVDPKGRFRQSGARFPNPTLRSKHSQNLPQVPIGSFHPKEKTPSHTTDGVFSCNKTLFPWW